MEIFSGYVEKSTTDQDHHYYHRKHVAYTKAWPLFLMCRLRVRSTLRTVRAAKYALSPHPHSSGSILRSSLPTRTRRWTCAPAWEKKSIVISSFPISNDRRSRVQLTLGYSTGSGLWMMELEFLFGLITRSIKSLRPKSNALSFLS